MQVTDAIKLARSGIRSRNVQAQLKILRALLKYSDLSTIDAKFETNLEHELNEREKVLINEMHSLVATLKIYRMPFRDQILLAQVAPAVYVFSLPGNPQSIKDIIAHNKKSKIFSRKALKESAALLQKRPHDPNSYQTLGRKLRAYHQYEIDYKKKLIGD